jgi:hypothetical protein
MDSALTATRSASTTSQRKTGLNQIAQILANDAAYLRVYYGSFYNFAQKSVGGLSTAPFGTAANPMPSTLYLT